MKIRRIIAAMLVLLIMIGSYGNAAYVQAFTASAIVLGEEGADLVVKPGEVNHVKIPIKAVGQYIADPDIEIISESELALSISNIQLTMENYNGAVAGISTQETTYVEFDVHVKEAAKIGTYPITVKVTADNIFDQTKYELTLGTFLQILEEKAPAQLTVSKVSLKDAMAGCDTELSFVIKNEGEITARNTYIRLEYGDSGIIGNYTAKNIKVGDLAQGQQEKVTLPIRILSNVAAGQKQLAVNFEYKDIGGNIEQDSYQIYVDVEENDDAPILDVESVTYSGEMKPGDEFNLVATLRNYGGSIAKDIYVSVEETSIGADRFIKNYFTESLWVADIKADNKRDVTIPMIVSKEASGGLKELKVKIVYFDQNEVPYTVIKTFYPEVVAGGASTKPNIVVSAVNQSPKNPVAGNQLQISFELENKGMSNISDIKIKTEMSPNTFIPVNSEPYQYIKELAGGTKKKVTIPLTVADTIQEGLNSLRVLITYVNEDGQEWSEEVLIPVLDVQNEMSSSIKPVLIVSKYTTDISEIKAGSTFLLNFDIHNTHSSAAAKNVTVTVSQADHLPQQDKIFSVTQGGNSFFFSKIAPGETIENFIELKAKSDAATGAYEIEIQMEYEYEGAEPNPQTGEIGENKVEKVNLQVVENSRPVVDYVNVYSWNGEVTAFNPATLAFEFYNMGKSPLNNVVATVEGDFTKADGNMYFIGNVQSGGSTYAEFDVIPNIEGMAQGILTITFEDSKGDEVSMTKEFETPVQGEIPWDGGMGEDYEDVFNPIIPEPKKPIMPVWAFVIMQVVIFLVFIPITRAIILSVYKVHLRKKEEKEYSKEV